MDKFGQMDIFGQMDTFGQMDIVAKMLKMKMMNNLLMWKTTWAKAYHVVKKMKLISRKNWTQAKKKKSSCGIFLTKYFVKSTFSSGKDFNKGFESNHIENWLHEIFLFLACRHWIFFSLSQNHFHSLCFSTRSEIHSTLIEIFVKWNILHSSYLFWVDLIVQLEH